MCAKVAETIYAEFGFIELWVLTANVFSAEWAKNKLQALNME